MLSRLVMIHRLLAAAHARHCVRGALLLSILGIDAPVEVQPLRSFGAPHSGGTELLAPLIQRRLEAGQAGGGFWASAERLTAERSLPAFYRDRGFQPVWMRDGRPSPLLTSLVKAIEEAEYDGLDPHAYHLDKLRTLLVDEQRTTSSDLVDLELLATDAFLVLGSHLLQGRVDPVKVKAEWLADRRGADISAVLAGAIQGRDIPGALDALRPAQARYRVMRGELARLKKASPTAWPIMPSGPTIQIGDEGARVDLLRQRLTVSGDLSGSATLAQGEPFDEGLHDAATQFQQRHGLDPDGAVGARTIEAMNVPMEVRMEALRINLERWRWMPEDLGRTHILVNIPDFAVAVREEGETVLRLNAIVGRQYRQTPVFSGRMTYLVLSPYWHVPPGIAAADKFPAIRQDPAYVSAQRMTLLDARSHAPVNPRLIDWTALTGAEFNRRYRLRQDPGPHNALGDVKFMFPNPHNVYLHDTPSRELFAKSERTFSSGCIRVDRPLELAAHLLRGDPSWTLERIRRTVNAGSETTVMLTHPVPVHLQYLTAFVDDQGRINYRKDIYDRDKAVLSALRADPPST